MHKNSPFWNKECKNFWEGTPHPQTPSISAPTALKLNVTSTEKIIVTALTTRTERCSTSSFFDWLIDWFWSTVFDNISLSTSTQDQVRWACVLTRWSVRVERTAYPRPNSDAFTVSRLCICNRPTVFYRAYWYSSFVRPSVCLSVRLSITRWCFKETA